MQQQKQSINKIAFSISSFLYSCEVAQFINLSIQECRAILDRYSEEQAREVQKIKEKYVC